MCAVLVAWTPELEAGSRSFGETACLGVKFSQGQPLAELEMIKDLRVRWVRENFWWREFEPVAGRFEELPPYLQTQFAYYRQHDIGVIALLALDNVRAYPPTRGDPVRSFDAAAFGRFAAMVASVLKQQGIRFILELGNEPHNSALPGILGGAWNGVPPSPWVDHYTKMVRSAVAQVGTIDDSIRMLVSDDMWVLHYRFVQAGLPQALDGFAVHPYTLGPPERAAVSHDTPWTQPFQVVDVDGSFESAVRRLREHGRSKLGRNPSIWITEWGWPVNEGGRIIRGGVAEERLAAYLPRSFILAAAAGVEGLCWFSSRDSADGPMGLVRNDGSRRASYDAYKTLMSQLGDSVLVAQVRGANEKTSGLQAFLFEGPAGRTVVAWSADAVQRRIDLAPGETYQAVDTLGDPMPALRSLGSVPAYPVAAAPIYIKGAWSAVALRALASSGR